MKRLMILAAAVLAFGASACGGSAKEANEEILRSLPVFPGAQLKTVESYPVHDCGIILRRTLGHITNAVYRVPEGVTAQEIIDFYSEQLSRSWRVRQEHIDAVSLDAPVPTPPPTETPPADDEPVAPQPVQAIRIPSVNLERGNATLSITVFPTSPGSSAGAPHDFTISVDSEGKEERPYCD